MKVRIRLSDGKWTCTHTGKGIFALSLIPELRNLGIEVTDDLKKIFKELIENYPSSPLINKVKSHLEKVEEELEKL